VRPLPVTAATPTTLGRPETPTTISLAALGEQDLALLATELIRSGKKPSRPWLPGSADNRPASKRPCPRRERSFAGIARSRAAEPRLFDPRGAHRCEPTTTR
jgi:hypothetical protein